MSLPLLSLVTFVPLIGAAAILALPFAATARWIALGTTVVTFALSLAVGLGSRDGMLPGVVSGLAGNGEGKNR